MMYFFIGLFVGILVMRILADLEARESSPRVVKAEDTKTQKRYYIDGVLYYRNK